MISRGSVQLYAVFDHNENKTKRKAEQNKAEIIQVAKGKKGNAVNTKYMSWWNRLLSAQRGKAISVVKPIVHRLVGSTVGTCSS